MPLDQQYFDDQFAQLKASIDGVAAAPPRPPVDDGQIGEPMAFGEYGKNYYAPPPIGNGEAPGAHGQKMLAALARTTSLLFDGPHTLSDEEQTLIDYNRERISKEQNLWLSMYQGNPPIRHCYDLDGSKIQGVMVRPWIDSTPGEIESISRETAEKECEHWARTLCSRAHQRDAGVTRGVGFG